MRITNKLLGTMVAMVVICSGGATYAAIGSPSINMEQQEDHSIIIKVDNIPVSDVYGIEVEVIATESLTEEIVFESEHIGAFDVVKVDDTVLTLYVANDTTLGDIPTIELGTINGLTKVDFHPKARIKVVDDAFETREWNDVVLEYTSNDTEQPEPEIPLIPLEPAIPVDPETEKPDPEDTDDDHEEDNNQEKKEEQSNHQFIDTKGHWAVEEISNMVEKGILKGYSDNTFKPNASITRAEIAVVIDRTFQFADSNGQVAFSDVEKSKWYTQAVTNLHAKGIINGRLDGTFGLADAVTNEEIIVMLHRALDSLGKELESKRSYIAFEDEDVVSDWAKESVQVLYEAVIINGTPEGNLAPQNEVTRAQVAVMINRLLETIE